MRTVLECILGVLVMGALVTLPLSDPPVDTDTELLVQLQRLPRLPIPHLSSMVTKPMLERADPLLVEYVRITGRLTVFGLWHDQNLINQAVAICDRTGASLAVYFEPYAREWPPGTPPTHTGKYQAKVEDTHEAAMQEIETSLEQANESKGGTPVRVTEVLFDTEVFYVKKPHEEGAKTWNKAIDAKYNGMTALAKEYLGREVVVLWYASAFAPQHFTGNERAEVHSTSCYALPFVQQTNASLDQAYQYALDHGKQHIAVWVALGGAFHLDRSPPGPFDMGWDYDHRFSELMGERLNNPRGDWWTKVRYVVFWPRPFDSRIKRWGEDFAAYARAATR